LSIVEDAHGREVEKVLLYHMEKFILELGARFAFVGETISPRNWKAGFLN